jgi:hypothetical protein
LQIVRNGIGYILGLSQGKLGRVMVELVQRQWYVTR